MKIILDKKKLTKTLYGQKNLGFVPTMGAIHKAHLNIIKKCNKLCNKSIVSIFVNKPQFNRKTDYNKYPRTLKKDIYLLKKYKVNYLFIPSSKQIYPDGPNTKIKIDSLKKKLCGKFRPGHFESVVDVIDRFIKIIKPNKIFLGEKDMQQLKIIESYIRKKKLKIKLIACKTIRERNGVAYSSRNFLLTSEEKRIASNIYKLLKKNKKNLLIKKISLKEIKNEILNFGTIKIDYIKIHNINKLTKPFKKIKKFRIFIAYYLKKTRLIDNI
jgi:pantoate--beta-alanine ligase